MANRFLLVAADLFAASTMFGAAVSVKEGVLGEPLGLVVPGTLRLHLAAGLGSGLSAPWPMSVTALLAAAYGRVGSRWPGLTCAGVGTALFIGTLVEPVTWGRRSRSAWVAASVLLNVGSAAALVLAGRKAAAAELR